MSTCNSAYAQYRSYQFAIKTEVNGNGRNGRNGSTFPFIISASSVFSVAMTTNRYQISSRTGAKVAGNRINVAALGLCARQSGRI
jgi:hypothetical protein